MNDSEISDEKVEEKSDNEKESEESVDEIKEQLIRLAADFDNYRKRIAKNAEQDRMRIKGEIVNPFLDILDSMQAAKNATYNEVSDVLEGLTTLNKQIEMVMENQGVVKIEREDDDFLSRTPSPYTTFYNVKSRLGSCNKDLHDRQGTDI